MLSSVRRRWRPCSAISWQSRQVAFSVQFCISILSLQRRVKECRGVMANKLVYSASEEPIPERYDRGELVLV